MKMFAYFQMKWCVHFLHHPFEIIFIFYFFSSQREYLKAATEEEIFAHLSLEYIPPSERNAWRSTAACRTGLSSPQVGNTDAKKKKITKVKKVVVGPGEEVIQMKVTFCFVFFPPRFAPCKLLVPT